MGLLSNMLCANWSETTLLNVMLDAESRTEETFDFEHLELDDGRDFLMAVVTGMRAEKLARHLERLRIWSEPAPADAPAIAHTDDEDVLHIVELLQEWHRSRIEKLRLLANAGSDVSIQVPGTDGQPLELSADQRIGLMVGVDLALQMFGTFPLMVEEE